MASKKRYPETKQKCRVGTAAKNLKVLDQCLEAGYNPVDGIIEARAQAKEVIEELEFYLEKHGPAPWYLSSGRGSGQEQEHGGKKESARSLLFQLREYMLEIDQQIMPYCHPKLKASEDEPDQRVGIQMQVDANDSPEEAAAAYKALIEATKR